MPFLALNFQLSRENSAEISLTIVKKINYIQDSQSSTPTPLCNFSPSSQHESVTDAHSLQHEPICFVANTDSVLYIVDTTSNWMIVNDSSLMPDLKITTANIKCIGGKGVHISGTGKITRPLISDDGNFDTISSLGAFFVPSSPYNIIPPQMLISQMKSQGYFIIKISHNNTIHKFKHTNPSAHNKPRRTLTAPIGWNSLFQFRSNNGYNTLMSRAPTYYKEYKYFTDAANCIHPDEKSSVGSIQDPSLEKNDGEYICIP